MCELMGYHFTHPIVANFSMREFGRRGEENADGWGLAWYPDESLALVKEPLRWRASQHMSFLESYPGIRSSVCIAHVRHMTRGRLTHADTHPFARELAGVEFCFAHNGTVPQAFDLPLDRFRPLGQTDSEYVFCHLLGTIAGWEGLLAGAAAWPRLHELVGRLNHDSRLNFLLSDGRRLFAYHDQAGWKGLHFKPVLMQNQEIRCFEDLDMRVELDSPPVNCGVVIATCPLSLTGWESFRPGELLVLEEGRLRWSSHRKVEATVHLIQEGPIKTPAQEVEAPAEPGLAARQEPRPPSLLH